MNFKSVALSAAKSAEKILLKHYGRKIKAIEKPNKSLVAKADLEANRIIINTIKKYFPTHSILSEETGFEDKKSDYKWVIDPLDGTHNFLHGINLFGTSIALERDGEVILGVMHFPVLGMTAVAEKGKGAFLNGKKLRVSGKSSLSHAFILFEFAFSNRTEKIGFLERLMNKPLDIRDFGSAIYDLLLVASGQADAHVIYSTYEWDVAAGFLLVKEAGGKITNLTNKPWDANKNKFLASNGKLHDELLKYVK